MSRVEPTSPLTIIAIFAGIIEASALASLPFLSEGSQTIYTWFLVCFPFFLTVLFFLTLNFNYKSLYIPSSKEKHATTVETPQASAPPPECTIKGVDSKDVITIALSGSDARAVIEKQVLSSVEQQPTKALSWVIYNLDRQTCITVSVRPMQAQDQAP